MTQIYEKQKKNWALSFIAVVFVEFAVVLFMNSTANMTKTTAMDTLFPTNIRISISNLEPKMNFEQILNLCILEKWFDFLITIQNLYEFGLV